MRRDESSPNSSCRAARGAALAAIATSTIVFSIVCAVTFLFARQVRAWDYLTFFRQLLGPGWILFECAYVLFIILILAVYGAAAGSDRHCRLGVSPLWGTAALAALIAAVVTFGNASVERMFALVSYLLYARLRALHRACPDPFRRPHRGRISRSLRDRRGG